MQLLRRMTGRPDSVDEHAAQARAVVDAGQRTLTGERLVTQLAEVLAPVYEQDFELTRDDVMTGFVRQDAQMVARRLGELGLAVVRVGGRR